VIHLENKTAVITGSSSGIGRAIALRLSEAGAQVVLHGREFAAPLEELVSEIASRGQGQATYLLADLAVQTQLTSLVDEAWSRFGSVDVWINNAGADVLTGQHRGLAFAEKLELLWRTDVVPSILLSREVGRRMRDRAIADGAAAGQFSIINIGWDQARHGMAGDAGELFGAAKGAIMAATKSLAQSLAPQVRVNCVAPGWIRTAWGQSASEAWQVRATQESLMERWGTADDVAQVVAFLVSPAAEFISGQVLSVNGGFRFNQNTP
jgi:3-oxoacyl-[acyl-carrier protein] reductase